MLLTDDFVYVHMPKTGGTFVTEVINRLYERETGESESLLAHARSLFGKKVRTYVEMRKHGTCSQIPRSHRGKMILATVRNPYDRYVSEYEFGWWRTHPDAWNGIAERAGSIFSNYPDLSFEEFVQMANTLFPLLDNSNFVPERRIGYQTEIFVRYFMKDPAHVFPHIDQEYLRLRRYKEDLFDKLYFVQTGSLNQDLHNFLEQVGFGKDHLSFILEMGRVYPPEGGRKSDQSWEKYYTPDLKREVRTKERLLFELFPEFDI